jgi:uncharacterized membrane protein (UPF0127 family)
VVAIREGVSPDTYPEQFTPSKEATYVLELSGNTARENGIGIGSYVLLQDLVLPASRF